MKIESGFAAVTLILLSMACNRRTETSSSSATSSFSATSTSSTATSEGAENAQPGAAPVDPPAATKAKATADEASETPFPAFAPVVASPSPSSPIPCPAGARTYHAESSVFCAKAEARWGAGRHGPSLTFHPNGKLELQGQYRDGRATGGFYRFRDDGQLESYIEFDGDDEHGLRITFHPNGKRNTEGRYVNGKRAGVHKMWTEDGELWSLTTYADGNVTSTRTFDVKLRPMSASEAESEMAKVKALEAQQKKMLDGMKK